MSIIKNIRNKSKKEILLRIEQFIFKPKIRLLKTIYFNFRAFKFKTAIKFPVLIYGKFSLGVLGKVIINNENIKKGMIKFGTFDYKSQAPTRIRNLGTIIFNGPCFIWEGVLLELAPNSELNIGENTILGENVRIMLRKKCTIGKYGRIAFDTQIMDSDFHYMINLENNTINNCTEEVIIGDYNWIGNKTTIKKGTRTPDFTIVAGPNTLLNKNYTEGSQYPILAGSPAKEIGNGRRRIYNFGWERQLKDHFNNNSTPYVFKGNQEDLFIIK